MTKAKKVILIIFIVIAVAAIAAGSVYYVVRRNVVDGADGIGIKSIKPSGTDESGANVYKITLTDGTVYTFLAPQGQPGSDGSDGADGADGETPHIGENGNWFIGEIDTGVKAEGQDGEPGADGAPGTDGKDGQTPYIGDNGNWFIGNVDTGVRAEGKDGQNGTDGTSLNLGCVASGTGVFGKDSDGNDCCIGYAQYFRTGAGRGYLNLSISLFNSTGADWYRYIDLSLISSVIGINLNQPTSLPRGRATGYWTPINTKVNLVEASRYGATCVYNEKNYICLARIYTTGFNVGAWGLSFLDANDDDWSTYVLSGIEVEEV